LKASDVILQLYSKIPQYTDKFTVDAVLSSVTSVGLVATGATTTNHGLSIGDLVNITEIKTPVVISTLTRVDDILFCETATDHDLTEGYQENVEIADANEAEFNGTFTLLSVTNRRNFTLQTTDSGATTGTGTILGLDIGKDRYTGLKTVVSVPTVKTFTYALDIAIPSASSGTGVASVGFRISGSATLQRAVDSYTKQELEDLWMFVVLGSVTASKDRNINSDAIAVQNSGTDWKQQLIQPFSIHCFVSVGDELSARNIRDDFEDIAAFIFKSIVGVKFESGLAQGAYYKTVFDSHGVQNYNNAIYIHTFNFQTVADLTFGDIVSDPEGEVAFRDISLNMSTDLMTTDSEILSNNIDLDEEAL